MSLVVGPGISLGPGIASGNSPLITRVNQELVSATSNAALNPVVPVVALGGTGSRSYAITPSLPTGLNFNTTTGVLSGTPTVTLSQTEFTVTATDSLSQISASAFNLAVETAPALSSTISPSTILAYQNSSLVANLIVVTGGFGTRTYSISPSLPAGLSINSSNGVISGVPTGTQAQTTYSITATDQATQTTSQNFNLTVVAQVVATLNVPVVNGMQNEGLAVTPVGGSGGYAPLVYSISPSLPSGLSLNTSTGSVSGVPTGTLSQTVYTVTVTDTNATVSVSPPRSKSASFFLTVASPLVATVNQSSVTASVSSPLSPTVPVEGSGGYAPLTYSISPSLFTGLLLNTSNGAISGLAANTQSQTTFTVTVTDRTTRTANNTFALSVSSTGLSNVTAVSINSLNDGLGPESGNKVYVSSNGVSWTTTNLSVTEAWSAITYGSNQFVAIAGGRTGASSNVVLVSQNGTDWQQTTVPSNQIWLGVTYGNSIYMAGGPTGNVVTSNNGVTWASAGTPLNNGGVRGISYGNGRFVVGGTGSTNALAYSNDNGATWANASSPVSGTWRSIAYGQGRFVALSQLAPTGRAIYSNDGITWVSANSTSILAEAVGYGNGRFVAVNGQAGSFGNASSFSTNGIDWTAALNLPVLSNWTSVQYAGNQWIAAGANAYATSPDAVTWTQRTNPGNPLPGYIAVFNPLTANTVVASVSATQGQSLTSVAPVSGTGGIGDIAYTVSPNLPSGLTISSVTGNISGTPSSILSQTPFTVTVTDYKGQTANSSFNLTVVIPPLTANTVVASVSGTQGQALTPVIPVVGSNGIPPYSYSISPTLPTGLSISSGDGQISGTPTTSLSETAFTVTVTDQEPSTANSSFNLTVAATTSRWVTSGGDWIAYSDNNGETWANAAPSGPFVSADYWKAAFGNSTYVISDRFTNSTAPFSGRILRSTTGTSFSQVDVTGSANGLLVSFGANVFAMVEQGTSRAWTSSDGTSWTQQTLPVSAAWIDIAFGNGIFLAVPSTNNTTVAVTSTDGTTWTQRTLPSTGGAPNGVSFGNGLFVVLSSGNNTLRTTTNGVDWNAPGVPSVNSDWVSAAFGAGIWVVVGFSGANANYATTTNFSSWNTRTFPITWQPRRVIFDNGTFIVVGATAAGGGTTTCLTSSDGINWTQRTLPSSELWRGLAFGSVSV